MKSKILFVLTLLLSVSGLMMAQEKKIHYKPYGQIRTDLYYNSRENTESVDGLFYLFPKEVNKDEAGNDLNSGINSNLYMLYSRLGVDISTEKLFGFNSLIKLEADFRGSGTSFSFFRLRHAYLSLYDKKHSILIGQTWHPLFEGAYPKVLNLSTGAPFNPFSRAPQLRYQHNIGDFSVKTSLIWQSQFVSLGVDEQTLKAKKGAEFIKKSAIPEAYLGIEYNKDRFRIGAGALFLSIKPRTISKHNGKEYRVDERLSTFSYQLYSSYTTPSLMISMKSLLASNITQTSTLGGFTVKSIDEVNGKREYTPIKYFNNWINIQHGKEWIKTLFLGYSKRLKVSEMIDNSPIYALGERIESLSNVGLSLVYNKNKFRIGLEYTYTLAKYGDVRTDRNNNLSLTDADNHRMVGVVIYQF